MQLNKSVNKFVPLYIYMGKQIYNEEHRELLEEKHQNTIQNIRELQEMEKYMYENLAKLTNEGGYNAQEEQIVKRISELTQMRVNLFNSLKDQYTDAASDLNNSRRSLRDQILSVELVEEELKETKKNYKSLLHNKNNKVRMVEIGTYETERYNAHIDVLKIISFTSLIVIVLSGLYHRDFIPGNIVSILLVVTISVGIILVIRKILDIVNRSNMVYDQYNWNTNHSELQPGYQGILQHDKIFFEKVGESVEGTAKKGASQLHHAADAVNNTMTHSLNTATKEVQPAHSSTVESFTLYH